MFISYGVSTSLPEAELMQYTVYTHPFIVFTQRFTQPLEPRLPLRMPDYRLFRALRME
jgi:hypothetical protein